MIQQSTIQAVQYAADIVDVVGHFVQLKKRGSNHIGLCPFHNEKTPSFSVSPSRGIYKCFGCQKAGNPITFLQEHEKMSYPEAIKWLAKRYHIEVVEKESTPEELEQKQEEESLRIINEFATEFFHDALFNTQEGQRIGLSYFKERGFIEKTLKDFRIGYCAKDGSFHRAAIAKGYKKELLIKAGLIGEGRNGLYDMYSERVIFPISIQSGKVIGFGARTLRSGDKAPRSKYMNTSENSIYSKRRTLYGIHQSHRNMSKQDECLIVEGYTDVMSLHQGDIGNVAASSGTALTKEQLYLIKRYTGNLTILFDGDDAGINAAKKGLDLALEVGLNVQVVLLPEKNDPDSFIREHGTEAFSSYLEANKKDIILFKLEASLKEAEQDSVKKSQLINEIAETLSKINQAEDFVKKQDYIRRCAVLLKIDEQGLVSLINKKVRANARSFQRKKELEARIEQQQQEGAPNPMSPEEVEETEGDEAFKLSATDYAQEKGLIRALLLFGDKEFEGETTAEYIRSKVEAQDFINERFKKLYALYFEKYNLELQYPDIKFFTYHEEDDIRNGSIEAVQESDELSPNWSDRFGIDTPNKEDNFKVDAERSLDNFYFRKLKNIIDEFLQSLENIDEDDKEREIIQQSIKELDLERLSLTKKLKISVKN